MRKAVGSTTRRERPPIDDICALTECSPPEESSSYEISNLPDADSFRYDDSARGIKALCSAEDVNYHHGKIGGGEWITTLEKKIEGVAISGICRARTGLQVSKLFIAGEINRTWPEYRADYGELSKMGQQRLLTVSRSSQLRRYGINVSAAF